MVFETAIVHPQMEMIVFGILALFWIGIFFKIKKYNHNGLFALSLFNIAGWLSLFANVFLNIISANDILFVYLIISIFTGLGVYIHIDRHFIKAQKIAKGGTNANGKIS